jgi:hypothetical protein
MNIIEADGEALLAALRKLLTEKNLVTETELAERMAATDNASPGQGAKMVARAWTDPAYRALMLEDGTKAAEAMNIRCAACRHWACWKIPSAVHNLIVCTLCSCYPAILIMAKTLVKVGR